jgi:hypothetical protein
MDINEKLITLGTNADTTRVILHYIRAWLESKPIPNLQEIAPEHSRYLEVAINEQHAIGWDQWSHARLSTTWSDLYSWDIMQPNIHTKYPSTLRKFVLESWYSRNDIKHDSHGNLIKRAQEKMKEEITWIIQKH